MQNEYQYLIAEIGVDARLLSVSDMGVNMGALVHNTQY